MTLNTPREYPRVPSSCALCDRHIGDALAAASASKLLRASAVASPSTDADLAAGCARDMADLVVGDIVLHAHAHGVSVGVRLERDHALPVEFQV